MEFLPIPAGVFEMGSRFSQNEMARRYCGRSSEFRHEKPLQGFNVAAEETQTNGAIHLVLRRMD
jgi:hypothetical protein